MSAAKPGENTALKAGASNPSNWQLIEVWYQTIGAAMYAAEAHLAWKPDAPGRG